MPWPCQVHEHVFEVETGRLDVSKTRSLAVTGPACAKGQGHGSSVVYRQPLIYLTPRVSPTSIPGPRTRLFVRVFTCKELGHRHRILQIFYILKTSQQLHAPTTPGALLGTSHPI